MRMRRMLPALLLALLCACSLPSLSGAGRSFAGREAREVERTANAALDAQLGLLASRVTAGERQAAREIWDKLRPLRQSRLDGGRYSRSESEWRLLRRLNALYEEYTIKYLGGDSAGFGYTNPTERALVQFTIGPDGILAPTLSGFDLEGTGWSVADMYALWDDMRGMLPEGAFDDFTRLILFTDGEEETMAYVQRLDNKGARWEIAVDPADADDGQIFIETVLHEYCHYLTLNSGQATYTQHQTVDTYNEEGMVTQPGSYLDDFYQEFWSDYLDDRLVNLDSFNFFLRHNDDFIDPYASTDPSEDLSESFTFFILRDKPVGDAVWERKLDFFYNYPALVDFRAQVRDNLGLEAAAAA